ncbi:unnamed protein product, partial [Closterium sp. NIES-53]
LCHAAHYIPPLDLSSLSSSFSPFWFFSPPLQPGGRVIWRSASRNPEYAKDIEKAGFKVVQVRSITQQQYMDRVNMYASFYVAIRNGGPENIQIFNEPPNPLALTNGTDAAAPATSS